LQSIPPLIPVAKVRQSTLRMSYQAAQLNYDTSITRASWNRVAGKRSKGIEREGTGQSIPSRDGWGIDSQVLSWPKVTMCIDVSISLRLHLTFLEKFKKEANIQRPAASALLDSDPRYPKFYQIFDNNFPAMNYIDLTYFCTQSFRQATKCFLSVLLFCGI